MFTLYHESHYTFRFGDSRIIHRFHLDGMVCGQQVSIIKINASSGKRLQFLLTATVGDGGWVDLPEPMIVQAGDAFIAVPVGD